VYRTARTTPLSRRTLLEKAQSFGVAEAARQMGVSRNTVYRWRRRQADLSDRSCRPHRSPRQTPADREAAVLGLRLERRWGPDRLGPYLGLAPRTAHRILRRYRMHRLRTLFPVARPIRGHFDVREPGELVHIDIKSLGRLDRGGGRRAQQHRAQGQGVGWRHLHVAIDSASRLVYAELRATLTNADTTAFVAAALAFFDSRGIRVQRVLTDNGTAYKRVFDATCAQLGIRHTRTKPHHPWTNGCAEAFIGTIQRECFYATPFTSEDERGLALWQYLAYYNEERPHTGIGGLSPVDWLRRRGVTYV
jgi:transposase InsO family protein